MMQSIRDKLAAKLRDNWNEGGLTFAFLGDSVTQSCFELYKKLDGSIDAVYDADAAYHHYLKRALAKLYPNVPVNIINAGIGGGNAVHALARLDRDVISHRPDLTVVCFALNDSWGGEEGLPAYREAIGEILDRLAAAGSEVIFLTPNMMCTGLSCHITDDAIREMAQGAANLQNSGMLDRYVETARAVCAERGVPVADAYAKWKAIAAAGVDVTELLANQMNHPTREMNWLFAVTLLETILTAP